MDITLEQCLASAVRFILDNDIEGTKAYFDEVPEKFYVPSVYFPVPYIEMQKATLRTFRNTITFDARIMDRSDWEAQARAASLRDAVAMHGLHIPIINKDGSATGKGLSVQEPLTRWVEEGIVSLIIPVRDFFRYEAIPIKAENFYMTWNGVVSQFGECTVPEYVEENQSEEV